MVQSAAPPLNHPQNLVRQQSLQITRDTARGLAVRPDTIVSAVQTHATGLTASLPLVADGGLQSVQATPGCPTLTSGRCTDRASGSMVSVQITPNLTRVTLLPSSFGLGQFTIAIPTSLPAYRVSIMVE